MKIPFSKVNLETELPVLLSLALGSHLYKLGQKKVGQMQHDRKRHMQASQQDPALRLQLFIREPYLKICNLNHA